jgi:trehalose utilization protein
MTLTEQLYEGTLPTGWYYFNNGHESYIVKYDNRNTKHWKLQEPEGLTVLAEVPTYDDIKALAKLVLKLSPERKEWLEKHYGEYL